MSRLVLFLVVVAVAVVIVGIRYVVVVLSKRD